MPLRHRSHRRVLLVQIQAAFCCLSTTSRNHGRTGTWKGCVSPRDRLVPPHPPLALQAHLAPVCNTSHPRKSYPTCKSQGIHHHCHFFLSSLAKATGFPVISNCLLLLAAISQDNYNIKTKAVLKY